jgi:hypothetical protein
VHLHAQDLQENTRSFVINSIYTTWHDTALCVILSHALKRPGNVRCSLGFILGWLKLEVKCKSYDIMTYLKYQNPRCERGAGTSLKCGPCPKGHPSAFISNLSPTMSTAIEAPLPRAPTPEFNLLDAQANRSPAADPRPLPCQPLRHTSNRITIIQNNFIAEGTTINIFSSDCHGSSEKFFTYPTYR